MTNSKILYNLVNKCSHQVVFSYAGSEWVLEDTLHLKNIHLPRIQVDPSVDLSYVYDSTFLSKKQKLQSNFIKAMSNEDLDVRRNGELNGLNDPASLVKTGAGETSYVVYTSLLMCIQGGHCVSFV